MAYFNMCPGGGGSGIKLASIAIITPPSKVAYHVGEQFDDLGMVVKATYTNGAEGIVTGYAMTPTGELAASDTAITVSYTEGGVTKATSQPITVATLASIAVTTPPDKTAYKFGESFNGAGMVVTATWTDGSTSQVTGYSYAPTGTLTHADSEIIISHTHYGVTRTTAQPITVAKILTGIAVTTPPTKTAYLPGDAFSTTGMVVTGAYSDESAAPVTGYSCAPAQNMPEGTEAITITYTEDGITKTATTPVVMKVLAGIAITTPPTKTEYQVGDALDTSGMTVTATFTDGSSEDVTGRCTFTPSVALAVTDTAITANLTLGSVTKTATTPISVSDIFQYGAEWNYSLLATELVRLGNAAGMAQPVAEITGTRTGESPFDSRMPWAGVRLCNLSAAGVVTAYKGDGNFKVDGTNGDVMVEIPKFWYKCADDAENSKRQYWIADGPAPGYQVHPAFMRGGVQKDHIYVGRYLTYNASSIAYSKSGFTPTGSVTRANFRAYSKAKGAGWYQWDAAAYNAIQMLYLIEYANWNAQTAIARDNVDSGSYNATGATNNMAHHTGRIAGTDGSVSAQYRYIENLWGNKFAWLDGINVNNRQAYFCTNPESYADDTASNYTQLGYVCASSNGYISATGYDAGADWLQLPTAAAGSETSKIPDYYYQDAGWRVVRVGGGRSNGSSCGPWFWAAIFDSSGTNSSTGSRLLYIPQGD